LISPEGKALNLSNDYSRFVVKKIPLLKEGNISQTTVINILESISDIDTLNLVNNLIEGLYPDNNNSSLPFNSMDPFSGEINFRTVQEFSFAKMFSWSLEDFSLVKGNSIRNSLEINLSDIFPFVLADKQNKIVKECLKSRLFNPFDLDKLLVTPATPEAIKSMVCSDFPNKNLDELRKGLLDFDNIKEQVKEFYNAMACETHSRPDDEPDPLDDAIRYGMILIFIRLLTAEIILRSIFFFSRFSATQTIVDSSAFLSLIRAKIKRNAMALSQKDQENPSFYEELKEMAYKKLRYSVAAKGQVKLLSNTIIFDDSKVVFGTGDKRQITNFSQKIYNLDDLSVLEKAQKTKKFGDVEKAILMTLSGDNMEVEDLLQELTQDPEDVDLAPLWSYITLLKSKFNDLALKYLINNDLTNMAPQIDSIFLDKDRINIDTTNILLASNEIFDVPSSLWTVEKASDKRSSMDLVDAELITKLETEGSSAAALAPETKAWVDFNLEKTLITYENTTNAQNVCLDVFTDRYAYTNASIYNEYGRLTTLGEATKGGGFVLQKYVEVKIKPAAAGTNNSMFISEFKKEIARGGAVEDFDNQNTFIISYKNFDFAFHKGMSAFIEENTSATTSQTTSTSPTGTDIGAPTGGFAAGATQTQSEGKDEPTFSSKLENIDIIPLSDLFTAINHGLRLVYVFPHQLNEIFKNTDLLEEDKATTNKIFKVTASKNVSAEQFGGSVGEYDPHAGTIENLLIKSIKENENLKNKIFVERGYQIKELVAPLINSPYDRTIVPFYIVPIKEAAATNEIPGFSSLTLGTIAALLPAPIAFDAGSYSDYITPIANDISVMEKMGADPKTLLPDLFEKRTVKIFNDYILSNKNLLNFAVLQQAFFPYSTRFDFDNLFAGSKNLIQNTFSEATTPKNDHEPAINSDMLNTWGQEIDKSMSGLIPPGALYEWLSGTIPKWILRFFLETTDSCMKEAFEIQKERGWSDEKLPEIIFGSKFINPKACADIGAAFGEMFSTFSGVDIPIDNPCLSGIKPVPIFPPFPPFMGDPTTPITAPGLIYTFMQFLVGYKAKYPDPEELETPVVDVTGQIPDLDLCAPNSTLNENPGLITQDTTPEE